MQVVISAQESREQPVIAHSTGVELSGGMMQLVGVALVLTSRPKLLLADEPTSALDVLSKMKLLDLLSKLHQEEKMAILFVTHDISVAEHLAQKVVVMKEGQIVESGPAHQIPTQIGRASCRERV